MHVPRVHMIFSSDFMLRTQKLKFWVILSILEHFYVKILHFQKILAIFRRLPPALIWTFWPSDFACTEPETWAVWRKLFRKVLGTFRGKKIHFSENFGKKWQFFQFSEGCHRLQFWPFYNPISRAWATELGQFCAGCFGRFLAHLGVKKSILVQFWTIFLIFLASFCCAFGFEIIKQLTNICLTTLSFIIYPF